MNKNQIIAIIIAVLMIGSIIGFAVTLNQDKGETPNQPPQNVIPPAAIKFSAQNVSAKVMQTFNSMVITAQTKEADISKLDLELKSISGIRQVNSKYASQTPEQGLTYVAFVSFDASKTPAQITQELTEKSANLEGIQGIVQGIVEIPKKLILSNADLNLSKEYEFQDTRTNAYLGAESVKGDEITVSLEVQLADLKEIEKIAFEEKNISAQPKMVMLEQEFVLNELKPEIELNSRGKLVDFSDANEIDLELKKITGITEAITTVMGKGNLTKAKFNSIEESQLNDLNLFISGIQGLEFEFDENSSTMSVQYYGENGKEILTNLNEKLRQYDLNELIEPNVSFSSQVTVDEASLNSINEIAQKAIDALKAKGFDAEAMRKAIIKADTIYSQDENASFAVKDGAFDAGVSLDKKAGDNVMLQVFFYGIRGNAEYLQAAESAAIEPETQ